MTAPSPRQPASIPCARPEQRFLRGPMGKPGAPMQPPNGTYGEYFHAAFCYRCARDTERRPCRIWGRALGFGIEDPEYPKEWIYGGDGHPLCTAWKPKDDGGPRKPYRPKPCPDTGDMFGPRPVRIGAVDGIRDKALAEAAGRAVPVQTPETTP